MDQFVFNELENPHVPRILAVSGIVKPAFAKMQFTNITDLERKRIAQGLLKYCELDTLAMVMIWEYFWEMLKFS